MGRMKAWGMDIADAVQDAEDKGLSDEQTIQYVQKVIFPSPSIPSIEDAKKIFGKENERPL